MSIRSLDGIRRASDANRRNDRPDTDWQKAVRQALQQRAEIDGKKPELRPDEEARPIHQGDTLWELFDGDLDKAGEHNPQVVPERLRVGDPIFVETIAVEKTEPPPYAPSYDPKTQPELALRADLLARYLGGTANGKERPTPETAYGVAIDRLAETMADGNPLDQAAFVSMYGGKDPLTGTSRKPLWEEMGLSREALRQTLVERPWQVASHQLGRDISAADYAKLQKIDGPLGHMLNLGVDPRTALSIQATWSAHFHGGYDPISQAKLKPVWERWRLGSVDQLQELFADTPAAAVVLADLAGGKDPATGQAAKVPWGDRSAEIYGAEQLKSAQDILGVDVLPGMKSVVSAEDAETIALGFTTPSSEKQIKYINPIQYAQSPALQNSLVMMGGNVMTRGMTDPLGGVGLFGLVKGYPQNVIDGTSGRLTAFGNWLDKHKLPGQGAADKTAGRLPQQGETERPIRYQAHGFFQVLPDTGETYFLTKVQRQPRALKGEDQDPNSRFGKLWGNWSPLGGGVNLFLGRTDEAGGSRGRRPTVLGMNWANAPDGTIERFGGALGGPLGGLGPKMPLSSQPYHSYGLQFQMGKTESGEWVPSGIGSLTEWGTNRYQFWPMATWDPDGGGLTGGSVWGGTGWTLGQAGLHYDPSRPTTRLNLLGGGADGRMPSVSYSDPSVFAFDLGGMYGKSGKALGLGISAGKSSDVKVSVDVADGDVEAAERKAKDYHRRLAAGEITALDLPQGVRVASTAQDSSSLRAMGFFAYVNLGASRGGGMNVTTDISRTGDGSWTVARTDEPKSDWSWNAGVFGIGPGGHYWNSNLRGESLAITAPAGTDGKPALAPRTRAALDRYLTEGLIPGATEMDGRFNGDTGANYKTVRDAFSTAERTLADAKTKPVSTDPEDEQERQNAVAQAEGAYADARSDLNDFLRSHLNPGDEIMPGMKIESVTKRDTKGSRPSFLVPLESKTITRGETRTEKNTVHTYELSRKPLIGWDYENQHAQRTGASNDVYQLSSTGMAAYNEGHISRYLPIPVLQGLDNLSVYQPLWQAALDKKGEQRGTLSVQFTDDQIVALGQSLGRGEDGKRLWASFADRTSGAIDDRFLQKNLEYRDNNGDLLKLSRGAEDVLKKHGLGDKSAMARKFQDVTSPEAFATLSDKEQDAFLDLTAMTASADHSPYESVALISAVKSEDRRSDMFRRVIDGIADTEFPIFGNTNSGPGMDKKDLGTRDLGLDRVVYTDDPTVEFVRFLSEDVKDPGARQTFLRQTGFQGQAPQEIESRRDKPLDQLAKEASEKYTKEMTIYFPGGPEPKEYIALEHGEARDMVGILAAVAGQKGSDGAWDFMKEHEIDPAVVFSRLDESGGDQVLRQALVDVLRPGSLDRGKATADLLNSEEKRVQPG